MNKINAFLGFIIWANLLFGQGMVNGFDYRIDQLKIESAILTDETHTISVYLPQDYEKNKGKYPVLYVNESIYHFLNAVATTHGLSKLSTEIPEMIVVDINTKDRWRDLSPTQTADYMGYPIPQSGNGPNYLAFLEKEVIPKIDSTFRTETFRVIYGHSLGGLFSLYSLVERPNLFKGYIASSPNLEYDEQVVTKFAQQKLKNSLKSLKFLYLNGDKDATDYEDLIKVFTTVIDSQQLSINYLFQDYPTISHREVPNNSLPDGLKYIFKAFNLPNSIIQLGAKEIKQYYEKVSMDYGYSVKPLVGYINYLGYNLLQQDKLAEAIAMFELNVAFYPNNANVYDSLGEAYLKKGVKELAKQNYEKALLLNPENKNAKEILGKM